MIVSPLRISKDRVVGPLPNGRTSWLINGGDPNYLRPSWDDPPSGPHSMSFTSAWQEPRSKGLLLPLSKQLPETSEECPVRVYRWKGPFVAGGSIPEHLLMQ